MPTVTVLRSSMRRRVFRRGRHSSSGARIVTSPSPAAALPRRTVVGHGGGDANVFASGRRGTSAVACVRGKSVGRTPRPSRARLAGLRGGSVFAGGSGTVLSAANVVTVLHEVLAAQARLTGRDTGGCWEEEEGS